MLYYKSRGVNFSYKKGVAMNGGKLLKFSIILNLCITLSACGTESAPQPEASSVPEAVYDWKTEGFMAEGILQENILYTVDYEKVDYMVPKETMGTDHFHSACSEVFYILDKFYTGQEVICNYCSIGEQDNLFEPITLISDMWNVLESEILGMDVAEAGKCVFWMASDFAEAEDGKREAQHYYIVHTDSRGNLQNRVDIIDTLREHGIWEDTYIKYVGTQINCDAQGNLYLCDQDRHTIYLLDQEGRLITSYNDPAGEEAYFLQGIHTSDGEVVFICGSWDAREFVWLDPETGTVKQLATAGSGLENVQKWYGLYGEVLYCATAKQLISWNIATGEKKILLRLDENAVANVLNTSLLVQGENIKLLSTETNKRYVLTLSAEKLIIAADITFANICSMNSDLAGRVANFSRENPLYTVSYQDEANRERVLIEVANGSGPDVLYVSREDMDNLRANGSLGNLEQIISRETLDVLLPGALAMGTYDDRLLGLPISVYIRSLMTSKLYWQEDSWTIEDVLAILKEQEEITGIFTDFGGQDQYYYNLYFLMGMDIEHSPFIADGQGRFDSPEFKEVLSWVKKMTNNKDGFDYPGPVTQVAPLALHEGGYLGVEILVFGMHGFGNYYVGMGENFHSVGYPTETGQGSYMRSADGGMIVVNQNAVDKEGIKELLGYLFSLESQQYLAGDDSISVRLDIPESQLIYMENRKQYFWVNPEGDIISLPTKSDKSSYLDEYVNFIQNAVPSPIHSDELFNIIMEEADSYFSSDKTLDETARVIQRKVQLYLDERN